MLPLPFVSHNTQFPCLIFVFLFVLSNMHAHHSLIHSNAQFLLISKDCLTLQINLQTHKKLSEAIRSEETIKTPLLAFKLQLTQQEPPKRRKRKGPITKMAMQGKKKEPAHHCGITTNYHRQLSPTQDLCKCLKLHCRILGQTRHHQN